MPRLKLTHINTTKPNPQLQWYHSIIQEVPGSFVSPKTAHPD